MTSPPGCLVPDDWLLDGEGGRYEGRGGGRGESNGGPRIWSPVIQTARPILWRKCAGVVRGGCWVWRVWR